MAFLLAQDVSIGSEDVAIGLTHGLFGSHLGVAYPDEDGTLKLLHLAAHKRLVIESYPPPAWIASRIEIPPVLSSQVVALLREMGAKNPVPGNPSHFDYGINLVAGQGAISGDGTYSPNLDSDGFTCASIIAEVFRFMGAGLVALESWTQTNINYAWGCAIVCMLKAAHVPEDHIKAVEKNNIGLRLRPEEVAAAAEAPFVNRPVKFDDLSDRADELFDQIGRDCGPAWCPPKGNPYFPCVDEFGKAKAAARAEDARLLKEKLAKSR